MKRFSKTLNKFELKEWNIDAETLKDNLSIILPFDCGEDQDPSKFLDLNDPNNQLYQDSNRRKNQIHDTLVYILWRKIPYATEKLPEVMHK